MPETKPQLIACMLSRNCMSSKNRIRTHSYVMPEWYLSDGEQVKRIRCFITDFQEPYVMVKYGPETPLFDERFINYGYNKVQLIEHLRAAGYQFYILTENYAVDLPHPDSSFRSKYLKGIKGDQSDMRSVYQVFQRELNHIYVGKKPFKVCKTLQSDYYVSVCVVCSCSLLIMRVWNNHVLEEYGSLRNLGVDWTRQLIHVSQVRSTFYNVKRRIKHTSYSISFSSQESMLRRHFSSLVGLSFQMRRK